MAKAKRSLTVGLAAVGLIGFVTANFTSTRLAHKPTCDCSSACGDDEEPEHEGEQRIWLEPADDPKQYGSDAPDGEYVNINESLHSDIRSAAAFRPMH